MKGHVTRFVIFSTLLALFAGCSAERKKARFLERAGKYFQASDYERAQIEYLNVLQMEPKNLVALEHLGKIWIERGAPIRAVPFLQELRNAAPDNRENQRRFLQIMLPLGKLAEARREALGLLSSVPDDGDALLALAHSSRSRDELKGLEEALAKANRGSAAFHIVTAYLQTRRGDTNGARASLLRARELDPQSPKVHNELAAHYLASNQTGEAVKALKTAAELAPVRSNERLRYAEILLQTGSTEESVKTLNEITAKAPDYLPAWRGLAYVAIAEKKFDEAGQMLDKIFKIDPSNYDGRIARAKLHLSKGENKQAIEVLEQLGTQFPGLAEDKFVLANVYLQNGDSAQAVSALRKAVAQNPDHEGAILLLGKLNLAAGDAESAARAASSLLLDRPTLLPAQVLLLDSLKALGKLDQLADSIRKQIQASPDKVELHRLLGIILKQQGKFGEARKSLERSLELTPDVLPVVAELVSVQLAEKDYAAAQEQVRRQLEKTPDSAAARVLEAQVYAAQQRWDEATPILFKTLELNPDYTPAYDLLTSGFAQKPSTRNLALLDEFVTRRPENWRAAMIAGSVYNQEKQFEKAAAVYEKHLAAKPESAAVLNNLAVLCVENLDQSDRALELARKARKLEPASPVIADTLGWVLFKRKEYTEAFELFKESAAKLPKVGEIQYHLGLASQAVGDSTTARAAFEKAGQAPEQFPGKDQIPQKLAQLGPSTSVGAKAN